MIKITWNPNIPVMSNQIAADVPDIEENFDCLFKINIWIPASAMIPLETNGAGADFYEYPTNDIEMMYCAFDGTTEEYVAFTMVMPENWNRSTIKAKFYWSSATGSTTNDTVEWEIGGMSLSDSDALDTTVGTTQVISDTLLANSGADLQISGATPAITIAGSPALHDLVHFKVSRNVGGTDDMTEDAWLFGVYLQIGINEAIAAW